MSDLAEFLLARIAEDIAEANRADGGVAAPNGLVAWDDGKSRTLIASKSRVLAECGAKLRIAGMWKLAPPTADSWLSSAVLAIAEVYADHPDFDPGWRP